MHQENSTIQYLKAPANSLIREEILNYKLFFDLKITAAKYKNFLKIYKPEVDIEAADIIVEDTNDLTRKIQLKSRVKSTVKSWKIHKTIMLPGMYQSLDYGFDSTICPHFPGAFILIDVVENTKPKSSNDNFEIEVRYSLTDINNSPCIFLKNFR